LQIGFLEIQVSSPDKPLLCRDEQRAFVWIPLDPKAAIPPTPDALRLESAPGETPPPPKPPERRNEIMPPAPTNGQRPDNGQPAPPPPEQLGLAEVIAETEALRALLHDAGIRTGRLLSALKHQRRQSRAVQQAMASLRQLQLDR
jgi:hypothetical protein